MRPPEEHIDELKLLCLGAGYAGKSTLAKVLSLAVASQFIVSRDGVDYVRGNCDLMILVE
jgi:hypothetical protein